MFRRKTFSLSEKAKSTIHSYLKGWFNQAVRMYLNDPDPENPYKVKQLVRDLRKGVARQPHKPYSANVSFNHMLKTHIEPEDQEAVVGFLGMLASLAARILPTLLGGLATGLVSGAVEKAVSGSGLYLQKRGHGNNAARIQVVKGNGIYLTSHPPVVVDGHGLFL